MIQVSFTADELERATAISYLPVDWMAVHLGEMAFLKKDQIEAASEELAGSLDELGEVKSQLDALSVESTRDDENARDGSKKPESSPTGEPVESSSVVWKKLLKPSGESADASTGRWNKLLTSDDSSPETSTGRWNQLMTEGTTTSKLSVSSEDTSDPRIIALRKYEAELLWKVGKLFARIVIEGSIEVPLVIATRCREVLRSE